MLSLINNLGSMAAQGNLSNANNALSTSLQRLSSGLRINSGADDPAGLVISQVQQAQMSGLQAAITNTSNATNVVQTADGGLNEINALLVQVRGLAVSAANSGATDSNMLAADQAQITNALQTITRIATSTQYGKNQLLDGSHGVSVGLTGGNANDSATAAATTTSGNYAVTITQAATATTVAAKNVFGTQAATGTAAALTTAETLTVNNVQVQLAAGTTLSGAEAAINAVKGASGVAATDDGSGHLVLYSTQFGSGHAVTASTSAGTSDYTGLDSALVAGGGAPTTTAGLDVVATVNSQSVTGVGNVLTSNAGATNGLTLTFAASTSATTPYQMADANGTAMTVAVANNSPLVFQVGANGGQTASITIQNMQATAIGVGVVNSSGIQNLNEINVTSSSQSSTDILNVIDKAISDVSNLAGALGSFQDNTLQATAANLQTSLQNTTAANATIRDTNFATESTNYAQNQVLVQAGTQVLKNANQLPQLVLTLLQ